ncbi:efflux RND transporter permease subunit [Shigella flexneri]
MVNTTKVLQQVTDYYLTKEKDMFSRCLPLVVLASAARAKRLAFYQFFKPWSERVGEETSVTGMIQPGITALSSINKAVVFPFNLPAVAELGTASGFDMELLDNSGTRKTNPGTKRAVITGSAIALPVTWVRRTA